MKVAPVSADLLVKLAMLAGGVALAWYLVKRAQGAVASATEAASKALSQAVDSVVAGVNPASQSNYVYTGINNLGGSLTGQGSNFTVGGWLYDVTHPDPVHSPVNPGMNMDAYDVPSLGFGA